MTSFHKSAPGRREYTLERRRSRRVRRLRVGAVAVAGSLAFFGVAGASMQSEDLRAGLVSLASPITGTGTGDTAAEAAAPGTAAADDGEGQAQGGSAPEDAAAAKAAEDGLAAEEERAAEETRAAEAAVAEETRVAEEAAAAARAAEEQARLAAEREAAAQAAADADAAARAAEEAAAAEAAAAAVPVDDPAGAKAYAASALAGHGWAATEMTCLNTLWEKESNWMTSAMNASSGAYGIVQSLPAEKMASAGSDYLTSYKTQINWGLGYIESRYGSPCGALNFHYANNWY
ncbi:hypothetical protein OL239_13940 [Arthrobacter sp. ATA002]|uniref:aggregation-promoting factor C-terminal-like domain-containing protein n=1 Tax=Arthrobacter sp. ATA002 TaxID=2991715 RepID=UPI0022A715F4|nr:hypothetical protein [Arthrobacter sp. ATA002]WAP51012.1 hypothetical protein OL239_13940 [Arthrobacter sp. ATA002]